MKKFFKDFKNFINRGNILDLAIGMVIAAAFNSIVKSLVNDIIMPVIGSIWKVNISEAKVILVQAVLDSENNVIKEAVTLNYGSFFQSIIDFLIIAFSIFLAVKVLSSARKKAQELNEVIKEKFDDNDEEETKEASPVVEEVVVEQVPADTSETLLKEIRDILLQQNKEKEENARNSEKN